MIECPVCHGSGFSGMGSGYDAVCSECGGQKMFPEDKYIHNLGYSQVTLCVPMSKKSSFLRWIKMHKNGPYRIELTPTGVNTVVYLEHIDTGARFDVTDYESI